MRKIYSLVLMAAALLVGTNAWADVNPNNITSAAELQEAIDNAGLKKNVGTVTLTLGSSFEISTPIWIGTTGVDDDAKSIKLNMNGYSLTMEGSDEKKQYCMFVLSHGELLINNNASTKSELQFTGSASGTNSAIFYVLGSYKSSRWKKNAQGTAYEKNNDSINTRVNGYFSHLEIGENVKLVASGVTGSGIIVDEIYFSLAVKSFLDSKGVNYNTNLFYYDGTNGGLAQGVRVDIKGEIDFSGTVGKKSYGVKINGMVATTLKKYNEYTATSPTFCDALYKTHYAANKEAHVLDTCDAPFVHIHKSAVIKSNYTNTTDDNSAAIYAGGYAKLLVEGTAEGNNALYARSGEIEVHDATLTTTADHSDVQAGTTGASGAGSAIVANSSGGYAGQISITITGDTKISSEHGYAIEETVPDSNDPTQVQSITIEGGTIEGGDLGAIIVSEKTADDPNADVTIYGGKVSGDIQAGNGNENDLLPKDEDGNPTSHVTVVTIDGKPTIVVSEGAGPNAKETRTTWNNIVPGVNGIVGYADSIKTIKADSIVNAKWTGKGALTSGFESSPGYGYIESGVTVKLGELQMISGKAHNETLHPGAVDTIQQLRIMNGATLDVRHLMMNEYAQIIVEAGGKLIVEGTQGIVAPSVNNIILKTSETAQAIFLFNPAVTSNRHPNATIEFISNSYREASNNLLWQRFGSPAYGSLKTLTCENSSIRTFIYQYKNNVQGWQSLGELDVDFDPADINTPFVGFDMLNNQSKAVALSTGTKYIMTCSLYGNENAEMPLLYRWNPMANSYMAPVKVSELYESLTNQNIYTCESNGAGGYDWDVINMLSKEEEMPTLELKPLQAFVLNASGTMSYSETINYEKMVYNPIMGIPNSVPAPARIQSNMVSDMTKMRLIVTDENGNSDKVVLGQSNNFSDEFDSGYDAEKYMNDGKNVYVTTDDMKMATYAIHQLNNTYLGFSAQNAGVYTISFDKLKGESFALVDLETGVYTLIDSESNYQFGVSDNYTNDYRFKIVARHEMPTDIETIENKMVSNEGIYSITGQYIGEMNLWNTLPSGLYIVNGEKKIK